MKLRSITGILLVVLLIAGLFTGCAPTPAAQPAAEAAASAESSTAAPAATAQETAAAPLELAWIFPLPHPFGEAVKVGAQKFADEYASQGINVTLKIGPEMTAASQASMVEALMANGIRYIAAFPADAVAINGLADEYEKDGLVVGLFGAAPQQPTKTKFTIATDVKAAAAQATEYLIQQMGGKGNIINVLEVLDDPNTVLRKQGVEETVAKYPDVKIVQEISGMSSTEEATTKIESALSANIENVDGIICTGFTTTLGLVNVLNDYKSSGGTKQIHAVGIDTDPTVIEAIGNGTLDATIAQNPEGMGYVSLLILKYLSEGYRMADSVYFIDSGTAVVTKDNLTTYSDSINEVTQSIIADLTTRYLVKD